MSKSSNSIEYKGQIIHVNPQTHLVNLVDMWKAAGADINKKPVQWFRQAKTANLLLTLCKQHLDVPIAIRPKPSPKSPNYRNQLRDWMSEIKHLAVQCGLLMIKSSQRSDSKKESGTYAIPNVAIAYAEDLSPEFHAWALTAIKDRIEEEANPELAYLRGKERAVKGWKRQGKPDDWIQDRLNSIENYKQHTTILKQHGVVRNGRTNGYAACANAINRPILGADAKVLKSELGIAKKSGRLRDNLSRVQLTALSFAEAMADSDIETNELYGNHECIQACSQAASQVAQATQGKTKILSDE